MPTPKKIKSVPVIIVEHDHHPDAEMHSVENLNKINNIVCKEVSNDTEKNQLYYTPKQRLRTRTLNSTPRLRSCELADRFIANRKSVNSEYATYCKLGPPPSPIDWISDDVFNEVNTTSPRSHEQYRRRMACMSEGASESKVLHFGSTGNIAATKGASHSQKTFDPSLTFANKSRKLPKEPEQVLDLPEFDDNFFTNTVTWGAKNHVIAALNLNLYVTKKEKEEKAFLLTTEKEHAFTAVSCSSDGSLLVAATEIGSLQVWDIERKKMVMSWDNHHNDGTYERGHIPRHCAVGCISWKPNSNIFAIGCRSGYVNHIDCRSGEIILSNEDQNDTMICGLEFSPSGNLLATTNSFFYLKVWDWTGQQACFSKLAHTSVCRALAWNPWKTGCLATGGGVDDRHIRVWDVYSSEMLAEVDMRSQVCSLAWSPLTRELFAGCSMSKKHTVSVLNYPELRCVGSLGGHRGRVLNLGLGPCKTILYTASADEMLKFWKITETFPPFPVRSASCALLSTIR